MSFYHKLTKIKTRNSSDIKIISMTYLNHHKLQRYISLESFIKLNCIFWMKINFYETIKKP